MKQFQDWWDKECWWRIDFEDYTSEEYAEEAWKAALNWIYHEVKADGDSDNMFRIIFEEWDSE